MGHNEFLPPDASLQIRFWAKLQVARNEYLSEGLSIAVSDLGTKALDKDLNKYVPPQALTVLASLGLRGELWYPVPAILERRPMLLGYYRLLYGLSKKEFYRKPFQRFQGLEEDNRCSEANRGELPALCKSLIETGFGLFQGVQPINLPGIHELQLLTLGPQLRGAENNTIGQGATSEVFTLIRDLVQPYLQPSTDRVLKLLNAAGRDVSISFSSDPDISIVEALPGRAIPTVSVEIKGGGDRSNVHNRIGEAEKSHQKARAAGFTQFWTVVRARFDMDLARQESPATTEFFVLDAILDTTTQDHIQFRDMLFQALGIS